MKKLSKLLFILSVVILLASCKKDEPTSTTKVVTQFVYDGLSTYYFWADEMKNKEPQITDTDPSVYFESLLSTADKQHGWSWITDDAQALLADFAGTPKDFGYALALYWADKEMVNVVAVVKYVFPNTPASLAGLARGNIINKINGQALTKSNYASLFGSSSITVSYTELNSTTAKNATLAPKEINTDPVYYSNVYTVDGHKIAYLFYTGFISEYNKSLYDTFIKFKQQGVTDLVLDLRYNHGGAVTAATYLCSMIAPREAVVNKSTLTTMKYNNFVNGLFDKSKIGRSDSLGIYNKKNKEPNPLDANLNLNKVYIVATGDSYSASELTTYCLKPYMNVVHVGDTTGGKYMASWTLHGYDESIGVPIYDSSKLSTKQKTTLQNWAMQPIVAKYTNKDGADFSNPGYLIPDYLLSEGNGKISQWKEIGDTKDVLLGEAIYLITGNATYKPAQSTTAASRVRAIDHVAVKLPDPRDIRSQSVILDNVKLKSKDLQQLINIRNLK